MSTKVDAALTSGTSPGCRIHLLGAGAVGRALLHRISTSRHTLVAVTDRTGTVTSDTGLDARAIAAWKSSGLSFSEHPQRTSITWHAATNALAVDLVIDATSSDQRDEWASTIQASVIDEDRALVLVAKSALGERAYEWLAPATLTRVGCNAVLGGTGHAFTRDLHFLRNRSISATIVGNASTTTIITCIERGASLGEGIAEAARRGYLESDPELDLRGADAAVKLAIVASALTGIEFDIGEITCQDIRAINPDVLRARARQGKTTRLIARFDRRTRSLDVAYEPVPLDSVLAPPVGRVVYAYDSGDGDRRIYIGTGLGAEATADAAWLDVQSLSRARVTRGKSGATSPLNATAIAGAAGVR